MQPMVKRVLRTALSIACLSAAAACTTVFETGSLNRVEGVACRSNVGGYYLPKLLVRVAVGPVDSATTGGRGFRLEKNTPDYQYVADRRHQPYCLDYLASPTAKDTIAVERTSNGLLKQIYSNAEDRSAEIAFKLIDTAELLTVGALRSGGLGAAGPRDTADLSFDPFDPEEMTEVNKALRRFGYCVYIEGHSFTEAQISPQAWCSERSQERFVNSYNVMLAITPVVPEMMNTGILYRPNSTHKLVIRRKSDPTGREPWSIVVTKHIEAPNVSPIFSIGVYRALFATRKTELTFANGVLTNVKIEKDSELESFSRIPLRVAQAIVAIPTEVLQLRIRDVTSEQLLASKQAELIATLATLNQTKLDQPVATAVSGLPAGIKDPNKAAMEQCLANGASADYCKLALGIK